MSTTALRRKLARIETGLRTRALSPPTASRLTFDQAFEAYRRLDAWLKERGFADALAAVEAGEAGPAGLEDSLREQAGYDPRRRAWVRVEKALDAGVMPDDADLQLVSITETPSKDLITARADRAIS